MAIAPLFQLPSNGKAGTKPCAVCGGATQTGENNIPQKKWHLPVVFIAIQIDRPVSRINCIHPDKKAGSYKNALPSCYTR